MTHQESVAIIFGAVLVAFMFFVIWITWTSLDKRLVKLEGEPPKPEPEKPKPSRLAIRTRMNTVFEYGTTVQHPANGQLLIMSDGKVSAIFASGHWLSIQVVEEERKEEAKTTGDNASATGKLVHAPQPEAGTTPEVRGDSQRGDEAGGDHPREHAPIGGPDSGHPQSA